MSAVKAEANSAVKLVRTGTTVCAEHNHRENELEKLSAGVLDYLPYGICVVDREARVIVFNRYQEKLSAVKRGDVVGRSLFDSPALRANGLDKVIRSVLETGKRWQGNEVEAEVRVNSKKQKTAFRDEILPIHHHKQVVGAVIVSVPVTEEFRLRKSLQRDSQELDALFEVCQDGLMVIDRHYRILRINDGYASFFGTSTPEYLIGKKCFRYLRNKSTVCGDCPVEGCVKNGSLVQSELEALAGLGEGKLLQVSAFPAAGGDGQAGEVVLFCRDISAKAGYHGQTEEHTSRTHERVQPKTGEPQIQRSSIDTVLDNLGGVVAVLSTDLRILECNSSFSEILGLSKDKVVGKKMTQLTPRLAVEDFEKVLAEALSLDAPVHGEAAFFLRAGVERLFRYRCAPARLSDGTQVLTFFAEDITEEKQSSKRRAFQEKMDSLGVLASRVAHEINNPLEAILNHVSLLEMEIAQGNDPTSVQAELEAIQKQVGQISTTTSSLLVFTKSSPDEFAPVDVGMVLRNAIAVAEIAGGEADITVETRIAPNLPAVHGSESDLERCFVNILHNAADAIVEGGLVAVAAEYEQSSSRVHIDISDTGVGIPEADLDNIFDPFFTTKKVGRQVGLGLSISYGIVSDHKGQIEVKSVRGQGTKFSIFLPAMVNS